MRVSKGPPTPKPRTRGTPRSSGGSKSSTRAPRHSFHGQRPVAVSRGKRAMAPKRVELLDETDPRRKYNIAYIQLRPKRGKVRTVQVSDELNVDLSADGSVYGIELLNANAQLTGDKIKSVIVENRATGTREKLKLVG